MMKRVMHSIGNNIEIIVNDKADEVIGKPFDHFLIDIKPDWKYQWGVVTLSFIMFISCIINVLKQVLNKKDHI